MATNFSAWAQDNPYEITKYTFIDYDNNQLVIGNDTAPYQHLFSVLTNIGLKGQGKINIVQIGDSHIQADFVSGSFRKRLQSFFLGSISGRGFIFPYKVAQTNNPANYQVRYTGHWESCRNIESNLKCQLGLSGIAVIAADTNATITMSIADKTLPGYDFDELMIFHGTLRENYLPRIIYPNPVKQTTNIAQGYTLFEFDHSIDSMVMGITKTDSLQNDFILYGYNFASNDQGITYHTIGVNGARVESYLKCDLFIPHLSALNPDWVIVSLGTNDAYTNAFDTVQFKNQLSSLINNIKKAAPNCAILLTTPGDHRMKRINTNPNAQLVSDLIKETAMKFGIAYWDFNQIMGGPGSIDAWVDSGMGHTDYLHYTRKGYEYQGQLLFNAFLKSYDAFLLQTPKNSKK